MNALPSGNDVLKTSFIFSSSFFAFLEYDGQGSGQEGFNANAPQGV